MRSYFFSKRLSPLSAFFSLPLPEHLKRKELRTGVVNYFAVGKDLSLI